MDDWDLFDEIDIEDLSTLIALGVADHERDSKPPPGSSATPFKGGDHLRDLLNCGNDKRIYSVLTNEEGDFQIPLFVYAKRWPFKGLSRGAD